MSDLNTLKSQIPSWNLQNDVNFLEYLNSFSNEISAKTEGLVRCSPCCCSPSCCSCSPAAPARLLLLLLACSPSRLLLVFLPAAHALLCSVIYPFMLYIFEYINILLLFLASGGAHRRLVWRGQRHGCQVKKYVQRVFYASKYTVY